MWYSEFIRCASFCQRSLGWFWIRLWWKVRGNMLVSMNFFSFENTWVTFPSFLSNIYYNFNSCSLKQKSKILFIALQDKQENLQPKLESIPKNLTQLLTVFSKLSIGLVAIFWRHRDRKITERYMTEGLIYFFHNTRQNCG